MIEFNRISNGITNSGGVAGTPKSIESKKAGEAIPDDPGTVTTIITCFSKDPAVSAARAEKVEGLMRAIAAGTYSPDMTEVARKILGAE